MTEELIIHVINLFSQNLDKVQYTNETQTYTTMIFHPMPNVKGLDNLNDLQLTGYKLFLDVLAPDRLKLHMYNIEFVSQRGGYPHWQVVSKEPLEQILMLDENNKDVFQKWEKFVEDFKLWQRTEEENKIKKVIEEFANYKDQLTFHDPFQTFMEKFLKEQGKEDIESYQAQEPEVMNFEREG